MKFIFDIQMNGINPGRVNASSCAFASYGLKIPVNNSCIK